MKTLYILILALVICCTIARAQTFYIDAGTNPTPFYCTKDSCSATDSSFAQFTPPIQMYYRGFTLISKVGAVATFRLVALDQNGSNPTGKITAIDSLVTAASAVGWNKSLTSARAGVKIALNTGTPYRIEYINALNTAFIKPSITIWCTLN